MPKNKSNNFYGAARSLLTARITLYSTFQSPVLSEYRAVLWRLYDYYTSHCYLEGRLEYARQQVVDFLIERLMDDSEYCY